MASFRPLQPAECWPDPPRPPPVDKPKRTVNSAGACDSCRRRKTRVITMAVPFLHPALPLTSCSVMAPGHNAVRVRQKMRFVCTTSRAEETPRLSSARTRICRMSCRICVSCMTSSACGPRARCRKSSAGSGRPSPAPILLSTSKSWPRRCSRATPGRPLRPPPPVHRIWTASRCLRSALRWTLAVSRSPLPTPRRSSMKHLLAWPRRGRPGSAPSAKVARTLLRGEHQRGSGLSRRVLTVRRSSRQTSTSHTNINEAKLREILEDPEARPRFNSPDARLAPAKNWTSVTNDEVFLSHLLSTWYKFEQSFYHFVDWDAFLDDLRKGRGIFCSSLLVNSILASACVSLSGRLSRDSFSRLHHTDDCGQAHFSFGQRPLQALCR